MKNNHITLLPSDSLNFEELLDWVRNLAQESSSFCQEVQEYYQQLGKYHKDIANLMAELSQLKVNKDEERIEEARNIAETALEVFEAMRAFMGKTSFPSQDAQTIDELETELLETERGQKAKELNQKDAENFLKKYNFHKTRLGLLTQEDVSKLTGIDRRHISVLEQGKHKPQFKTLKKIADAFGIHLNELK